MAAKGAKLRLSAAAVAKPSRSTCANHSCNVAQEQLTSEMQRTLWTRCQG